MALANSLFPALGEAKVKPLRLIPGILHFKKAMSRVATAAPKLNNVKNKKIERGENVSEASQGDSQRTKLTHE